MGIDWVDGGFCIHWCDVVMNDGVMNVDDSDRFVLFYRWWWLGVGDFGFVAWRRRWWLGVSDFGFVLGLWESSREEREANNKKCKKNEYFIE